MSMLNDDLTNGLYSWYPFREDTSIIYCLNADESDIARLGKCQDSSVDYIVASMIVERSKHPIELLNTIRRILKPDGHLLLGCENRLGLRYFCGDKEPYCGNTFDGIENYNNYFDSDMDNLPGRLYASYELEGMLDTAGFTRRRRLSILPGLEMPQQFYASDYMPEEEIKIRFTGLYNNPKSLFLDETNLYDSIIKNGMFHQMANAYLYDCSIQGEFYEINHVTTSLDRGRQKATATIIEKSGMVVKKSLFPEGNSSIDTLIANTEAIRSRGIDVVPVKKVDFPNGCIGVRMPYMHCDTALTYLRNVFLTDRDEFVRKTNEFIDLILKSGKPAKVQPEANELGVYYEEAYVDMVPLNCFYDCEHFIFYDQEYVEHDYPIYVVVVRALEIIYMHDRAMLDAIPLESFLVRFGIAGKEGALDAMGRRYIANLRHKSELTDFYNEHKCDVRQININRQRINYPMCEYYNTFVKLIDYAKQDIYLFGSGLWARKFVAEYGDRCNIKGMLDNSTSKQGQVIDGIPVMSPDALMKLMTSKDTGACEATETGVTSAASPRQNKTSFKVIVCVKYYATLLLQLKSMGITNFAIYDPNIELPVELEQTIAVGTSHTVSGTSQSANNTGKIDSCTSEIGLDGLSGASKTVTLSQTGSKDSANNDSARVLQPKKYHTGYIAGVFDLFHVGHLNLLRRAKEQCDYLIVGVVSDEQASEDKSRSPYIKEQDRLEIVRACRYVDEAYILPPAASGTNDVYKKFHFDVQFSGSDYEHDAAWLANQEWLRQRGSDLVFFPYTQSTSSTKIKEELAHN